MMRFVFEHAGKWRGKCLFFHVVLELPVRCERCLKAGRQRLLVLSDGAQRDFDRSKYALFNSITVLCTIICRERC